MYTHNLMKTDLDTIANPALGKLRPGWKFETARVNGESVVVISRDGYLGSPLATGRPNEVYNAACRYVTAALSGVNS